MNYTLHQLQIFLKITETKSITKAAEALHLTQPAVSIQLKNFQDQFDVPLTEVIGRQLFITDFGKEIARSAETILNEVNGINQRLQAFKGKLTGSLRISVVSTGKYVMPYFLTGFLRQHTDVELLLDVSNKARVVESLEHNEVDFSLVSVLPKNIQVDGIELMQNKLYVVTNRETKAEKKTHTKKIFETLPLIYREAGSGTRQTMEKYFRLHGIHARKKMELTSNEAVKQAVIAGLGSSVMPLIGLKDELNNGDLHIIPVKGFPITSKWQLIWLKNKKFSPVAQAYLSYVKKEKNHIIHQHFDWYEQY